MEDIKFDLDWPGTLVFTPELALRGNALNKFALSLRLPACRDQFLSDQPAYMNAFGLPEEIHRLVACRDWTGLLLAGGHLQAILKIAATLGDSLWHIGAHNVGVEVAAMRSACPRVVSELPYFGPSTTGPVSP